MNTVKTDFQFSHLQHGFALLPVAIIISVIAAVSLLLSYESSMNVNEAAAQNQSKQAELVAEAGMAHAKWQLQQNTNCTGYTNIATTNFGLHNYAVNITPTSGSPVTVSANGISNAGITRTLIDTNTKIYEAASTQVIVLDESGQDSFIEGESGHTDHNKGNDKDLRINSKSDKLDRALLQFDLSKLHTSAKIVNASLDLYLNNSTGSDDTIFIHRLTANWVEDEVTWEIKRSGFLGNWGTAGGDYIATASGSFVADTVGWKSADITQLVQDWIKAPSINRGMILLSPAASGNNEKKFTSSDDPDASLHPKLTITYACECGVECYEAIAGGNTVVLSTDGSATLGGLSFDDLDLVEYDSSTDIATLMLEAALTTLNSKIRAVHILDNGHIVLSTRDDATLGGINFKNEDLVEYDPMTDTATMYFDGSLHFAEDENIISLHILSNGNLVLSTDGDAELGGLSFSNRDLVEYNPTSRTASIYFDGDATSLSQNITALHVLDNGHLVMATKSDTTLGGLDFTGADLIKYDKDTDSATLYFPGNELFSDDNEKINSVHIGTGSGEEEGELYPGLIAHWKFDENSGLKAVESINGFDGVLENSPEWEASGKIDGALYFDNVNAQVVVPHSDLLSPEKALTISAWVYNDAASLVDSYRIISKESFGSNNNYFLAMQSNSLFFGIGSSFFSPSATLSTNQWYHIVATFDDDEDEVRMYIDGVEVLSEATNASLTPNTDDLYIGSNWEEYKWWEGLIDDVRLYEVALTSAEIADIYSSVLDDDEEDSGGESLKTPGDCSGNYLDEFNTDESYSGNDGSLGWSADWIEINESNGAGSGDEQVRSDSGQNYVLRIRDNDGGGEGVQREADLSGYTNAILRFNYRRSSLDDDDDNVTIELSSNGGGSWTEIDRIEGPGDDSGYQSFTQDISSYISNNTNIRFVTSSTNGSTDTVYIDNVEIAVSGCAD